jgi:hypothetical protein
MSFHKLKGVSNIGEFGTSENVAENVIRFLDWGFVNAGGFTNVAIPASSIYGGNKERLVLRPDASVDGQCWEARRKNWVWEDGVDGALQPIQISGVYVNNTFYPKDTAGAYAHYYDYENGRVVFSSAIATNSTVNVEYAYKQITVADAYQVPFFQRLQYDNFTFTNDFIASGDMLLSGASRLQLPLVAVEVPPIQNTRGYELGHGSRYINHTILCHVVTTNPTMNRRIGDIIADQGDKTILMYNLNTVIASGAYPLDSRGMVASGAYNYPELVSNYTWKKLRITDGRNNPSIQQINRGTYLSTVRLSTEVILTIV